MTVVHPNVSTEGSLRTSALRFAILRTPMDKAIVTIAGSPSGMAATAKLMDMRRFSTRGVPLKNLTQNKGNNS